MRTLPRGPRRALTPEALGVAMVLASACGFGSGAIFVRGIFEAGASPEATLFWRFAIAAVASWVFLILSADRRRALVSLPWRRLAILVLLGALYVGNSGTYVAALQVVPITLSAILTYTYPAMVAVLSTRFIRRLEGRRAWVALAISMTGVALAVGGIPEGALPPLWGLGLALLSPVIYAAWIVLQARVAGDRPRVEVPPGEAETVLDAPEPAPAAAVMTTATAVVFGLILVAAGGSAAPGAVPGAAWPGLIGFGIVSTALAIQLFYAGIARVGGARAALISTVEPVYTITLATILFGEILTPVQLAGGLLVIGGVVLAESGTAGEPTRDAPAERAGRERGVPGGSA
jgi:drug/metabolite transporter (DMT)-like permease